MPSCAHPKACTFKQLSLSYPLFLFPHHPYSAMTRFHVQHKSVFSANELSQDILFIGSAPRPQAFILLNIAAAARTYGLDLCSERCFFILFCLFSFTMCHVKNKSCPVASQNSNIICDIISIQMRYSNQSQALLTMYSGFAQVLLF